jgi:hypothetical protein
VSAASRKGSFIVGRDGRLHDANHLRRECRLSAADASIPLGSLAEVEHLSRLVKLKACAFCSDSNALQRFWQSRVDRGNG